MVLAMRLPMMANIDRLWVPFFVLHKGTEARASFNGDAVAVSCPSFALSSVARLFPSCKLAKGVVLACAECLAAHHPLVIGPPASDDGIDCADNCFLRGRSSLSYQLFHLEGMAFDGFSTGRDECFEPERFPLRMLSRVCFPH